jgi:polyisoprenyl-phosphate glycosyltransferase
MNGLGRSRSFLLSVVIPCYNEAEVIRSAYDRVCAVLDERGFQLQPVFVNDGSRDATEAILEAIAAADPRVKLVSLARSFGHQAAVSAGLANADGDAVVVMDADLQDPPEVVLRMLAKWHDGFDVVYGTRTRRKERLWKRLCYAGFYRVFRSMADIDVPLDAGDFSLIDRRVLAEINRLPEKNRMFRGLRAWVGFRQTGIAYERQARAAGTTKYSLFRLITLAADGIFNFSTVPLRIVFVLGLAMSAVSMCAALLVLFLRIFDIPVFGSRMRDVQGFTSMILTVLLIGGIQLICTGILGEYIGRIYHEVKSRPSYVVRQSTGGCAATSAREAAAAARTRTEAERVG